MALSANDFNSVIEAEVDAAIALERAARIEAAKGLVRSKLVEQLATAEQRRNDRAAALANDESEVAAAASELASYDAAQAPVEQAQG